MVGYTVLGDNTMFKWLKNIKVNGKYEDDWKLQETWEDYPTPNYDATHTYCSVSFDDGDKTFYYRTRNPEINVGDLVYVPVGKNYEKKSGRVVAMKNYKGSRAPYPLERTKHILGKVEE